MQDQPYARQLEYKSVYIRNLLGQFHPRQINSIVASPRIWYFRNKMEFAVSGTIENPVAGLRPQKRFSQVVDIRECRVFYPGAAAVLESVRSWASHSGIEPYDFRRRTGCLRYVCMRHSKAYDESMIIFVMAIEKDMFEGKRKIFDSLINNLPQSARVASVYACLNTGARDNAMGGEVFLLYGKPFLRETINGINYQLGPKSFFQTNPYCCALLYGIIRAYAAGCAGEVLDLFCGCGGIGLQIAAEASHVTGIDILDENIEDARENCRVNGISNADFVCLDVQDFLLRQRRREN